MKKHVPSILLLLFIGNIIYGQTVTEINRATNIISEMNTGRNFASEYKMSIDYNDKTNSIKITKDIKFIRDEYLHTEIMFYRDDLDLDSAKIKYIISNSSGEDLYDLSIHIKTKESKSLVLYSFISDTNPIFTKKYINSVTIMSEEMLPKPLFYRTLKELKIIIGKKDDFIMLNISEP